MQDFRQLKVWGRAHELTLCVYRETASFPKPEVYGLVAQMRASSSSIATNIAEGCGRGSDAEMGRFLQFAMGSASELEYQILLAHDLGFLDPENHQRLDSLVTESKRMLAALIKKLKADG
jgi:four helix bundle protein